MYTRQVMDVVGRPGFIMSSLRYARTASYIIYYSKIFQVEDNTETGVQLVNINFGFLLSDYISANFRWCTSGEVSDSIEIFTKVQIGPRTLFLFCLNK